MSATETETKPCQCLRTKNLHGTSAENYTNWHPSVAASSTFWCVRTMSFAGPDDNYAHPARCLSGRSCYKAREE
jgi:hypothetical protein